MVDMYSIDRIEDTKAVLENIITKEKKEVDIILLPVEIKEGSIVSYKDDMYVLEITEEEKSRQEILKRFQSLRKD